MARKISRKNSVSRFSALKNVLINAASNVSTRIKKLKLPERKQKIEKYSAKTIEEKPFTVFFSLLGVMLFLIIVGSILRQPKKEATTPTPIKSVTTYSIGTAPKIHVQAQVEKSGVAKIVALSPGVVSQINVTEGQLVTKGITLISLSNNYSGGNTATLSRQLAEDQYNNIKDTYDTQKDIIQKQRDTADQNKTNFDMMLNITDQSITDTNNLINLDNDILSTLNTNLTNLENSNVGGANDAMILATKQQISQFQSTLNLLSSGQRQAHLSSDAASPAAQLAGLQHDIANAQLDIQQKALDLSLQTSKIQLSIAQVNEAIMFPAAPFDGVVERVYVNVGQNVNSGTPLVLINGDQDLKIVAKVPESTAKNTSKLEESVIHLPNNKNITMAPSYISDEATDGALYSIIYTLDSSYQSNLTNLSYVSVDIPVGYANTTSVSPFIPLDSVYQSQNASYIFVNDNGHAKSKNIDLGQVFGQYVEVEKGLSSGDEVIVSRNVLNGDPVK